MRRFLISFGFLAASTAALACGDKLMLIMRVRLAQLKLGRPIAILAYAERDLPSSALMRQIQLQPAVKKAGHRFHFIDDSARLDDALKTEKFDLVIADVAVADQLSERVKSSPFRPTVLTGVLQEHKGGGLDDAEEIPLPAENPERL